jgi:hypothetical protein
MYPTFLKSSTKHFENFVTLKMYRKFFENFQKNLYFPKIMNVPKTENLNKIDNFFKKCLKFSDLKMCPKNWKM